MAEQQPSKWGEILSIWNLRTLCKLLTCSSLHVHSQLSRSPTALSMLVQPQVTTRELSSACLFPSHLQRNSGGLFSFSYLLCSNHAHNFTKWKYLLNVKQCKVIGLSDIESNNAWAIFLLYVNGSRLDVLLMLTNVVTSQQLNLPHSGLCSLSHLHYSQHQGDWSM